VDIALSGIDENNAFRETIDASAFVTRRSQAILLGKYLCQTRRHSRRAIEFKTFPTDSFVAPGSYIYVEFAQNQWNRIQTGVISEGGQLNLSFGETVRDGSYQMLLYNPTMIENKTIYRQAEPIVSGASTGLRGFKDHVFVLGTIVRNKRVFRVTEVSMDEEGEVTIKGVEHGTDADGLSLISRGLAEFVPGLFLIDGRGEQQ
jgi:predicted phage tail protein